MKKVIRSSNLCLRFYIKDGWTKEELEECLINGSVEKSAYFDKDEPHFRYLVYSINSKVDIPKLISKMERLDRAFDDYPNQSDEDFMRNHI